MTAKVPLRLGVNIDHVATLRQARHTPYPDLLQAARCCEAAGADGITIHLREDRRHIQDADVVRLRKCLVVPMNLEMANTPPIVRIAADIGPQEVCIVPERREELTTEGGLDVAGQQRELAKTTRLLRENGISVSLFIDPDIQQIEAAAETGAPYIELHTGTFCNAPDAAAPAALDRLVEAATRAHALGLKVNAGHGIHTGNLGGILEIPHLDTLNIGHSIVCDAVFNGLVIAVKTMRKAMRAYRGGRP